MVEDNGKVPWYEVIRENMKDIKDDMKATRKMVADLDEKIDKLCIDVACHETTIANNKTEIDRLRASSNRWDAIITVVMVVLGALGLTKS